MAEDEVDVEALAQELRDAGIEVNEGSGGEPTSLVFLGKAGAAAVRRQFGGGDQKASGDG